MRLHATRLTAGLLAFAVTPGGSGHGFYASLIGEVGGRLKVLTRESLDTDNQGGIHVGDLGGGLGAGALGELRLGYTDLLQDMPDVSKYHWL